MIVRRILTSNGFGFGLWCPERECFFYGGFTHPRYPELGFISLSWGSIARNALSFRLLVEAEEFIAEHFTTEAAA